MMAQVLCVTGGASDGIDFIPQVPVGIQVGIQSIITALIRQDIMWYVVISYNKCFLAL